MSLVGPRPERPEFVSQLNTKIPLYRERHAIKPGITGWAQLCYPYGSNEKDAAEKLQYDLFYVKNRNILFYLAILVQTVEVILWGKGAR
jgi:lipopolysaccharide/colanic/teichoic acid biosynthesis glycosyltransferase